MSIQSIVQISTIIILVLTVVLSLFITKEFWARRRPSHLYWSAGLWMFAVGVLLEIVFAFGVYSQGLIKLYLFVVALIVELLALGSMQLINSARLKRAYYIFCIVTTALLALFLIPAQIGYILTNYVVWGTLRAWITVASSLVTFPAAAILITVAAIGYRAGHSPRMISIISGVVVVSIAGTLYIAAFPAFLYYSEFMGILLLWLGFFDIRMLKPARK